MNADREQNPLAAQGGQPLIFMVGCGQLEDGRFVFRCFTADALTEAAEDEVIERWLGSAKAGHRDRAWPDPRLFDFLNLVVRKEPVVVRGALGFETTGRGRVRGHGGRVERRGGGTAGGVALGQVEPMREIEPYNEVDCRVMAEVIGYLREHH